MRNCLKFLVIILSSVCLFLTAILINNSNNIISHSLNGTFIVENIEVFWAENIDEEQKEQILYEMNVDDVTYIESIKKLIKDRMSELNLNVISSNEIELVDKLHNMYEHLFYIADNNEITIFSDSEYQNEGSNIFEIGSKFIIENNNKLSTVYINDIFEIKLLLINTSI